MRALVTCCTALTGCPFKSYESQKTRSSRRFIYHGSGAGVTVKRQSPPRRTVLAGSWRDVQNTSKLKSVREVVQCRLLLVEWLASETSLSWEMCWLVDPSRLKDTSFPAPEDDRSCDASNASAVHGYSGGFGQAERGTRRQAANELAALRQEVRGAPLRGTQTTGVGVDTRLLGGVRWRSDTTSAEADAQCREGN